MKSEMTFSLKIDNEEVRRIFKSHSEVLLVYLFGSGRNEIPNHPLSDIDVGILFNTDKPPIKTILRLISDLTDVFKAKIDLVILNTCSIRMKFEVIKNGLVLFYTQRSNKIEFEQRTMSQYYDRRYYDLRETEQQLQRWGKSGFS
ncbi:MAG: nucleotidyltransferase domain-containing protein [Promethearchaeota archaeon]